MSEQQQLVIDAMALDLFTARPEHRFILWRQFEDTFVSEFRRANPDGTESALRAMLVDASVAIQKRLNELTAGETPYAHAHAE